MFAKVFFSLCFLPSLNAQNLYLSNITSPLFPLKVFINLTLKRYCIISGQFHLNLNYHYGQKDHCNDNCNYFSDYDDIIAPLDNLIMSLLVLRGAIMLHFISGGL